MKSGRTAGEKKSSSKMMGRGFMCQSPASTAVCVSRVDAAKSAIIPASRMQLNNANNSFNAARYSRLVESLGLIDPAAHPNIVPSTIKHNHQHLHHHSKAIIQKTPSVVLPSTDNVFQVVVMRVALHCHGCAGKVKKHISKMEGVTSFSIDLETKMVTVRGHVSPDGVLESISKVKKAELLLP